MAKWFGPVLQPCGCCYEPPPPPPPPPCACGLTDCFPTDELNFSALKFEIEMANSTSWFSRYREFSCATNCRNVYAVWETEWEWSGFAALNGTHEIPYYVYDDYTSSWIEGDPLAVPCGVWFYPTITAPITLTRTNRRYSVPADVYTVYADSACVESTATSTYTFDLNIETRGGHAWSPNFSPPFFTPPWAGPNSGASYPALDPPVVQSTRVASVFACSSVAGSAISTSQNVDATAPQNFSPLINIAGGPRDSIGSVPSIVKFGWTPTRFVGVATNTPFIKSSDYAWGDYPYGGPGIPLSSTICGLDIEEGEDTYNATTTTINNASLVACNPLYPFSGGPFVPGTNNAQQWYFENSAWSQRFKLVINTP